MRGMNQISFGETPIQGDAPADRVAQNMYLTFWYAQGNGSLDTALTDSLTYQYAHDLTDAEWQSVSVRAGDTNDAAYNQLRLPGGHGSVHTEITSKAANRKKASDLVRSDFELRWSTLGGLFKRDRAQLASETESDLEQILTDAENTMVHVDYRYNTIDPKTGELRKRRLSPTDDPHESFYRRFVLQGEPTGSEAFDEIFGALRERFIKNGPPEGFPEVKGKQERVTYQDMVQAWGPNHPGEPFEPIDDPDIQMGLIRGQITERSARNKAMSLPLGNLVVRLQDVFNRDSNNQPQ
jgi:hypothetical protein